jgi:hypothetical protein
MGHTMSDPAIINRKSGTTTGPTSDKDGATTPQEAVDLNTEDSAPEELKDE